MTATGPRQAELTRIGAWSALRASAAVSVIGFLAWMIAVAVLYLVLGAAGIWDAIGDLLGGEPIGAGTVFLAAAGLGALWVVLVTALLTLGAIIYNACAGLVGGVVVDLDDPA
ncbi:DUF3566 domain-containing protein [Corynebacterium sphenisci]|uniref:DUF3566 domain-containing protein n=1 Tax=Corynebacterium sphenisci TaxID=191493 RepID=UPI0026DF3270|nr:DUF3566 domain-containing protein [Corynebacterium sphenisci]MDO5731973.1 DUF3566 domain-containing protein [Corynebacterium sphenisci]